MFRPISSQYPNGHFVRSLGPIHQLDTEISAILVEHSISVSQASQGFSQVSLNEMPIDTPQNQWKPGEVCIQNLSFFPPPFFFVFFPGIQEPFFINPFSY
jgi:hypothetical protein